MIVISVRYKKILNIFIEFQAVIHVKIAAPKKEAKGKPTSAPSGKGDARSTAGSITAKPVKRPACKYECTLNVFFLFRQTGSI